MNGSETQKGRRTERLLLVEDSLTQSQQLQEVLTRHGYTVTLAHCGAEALECLSEAPPTLVITDVLMPEMDGFELCRRIKDSEAYGHIPVILLTELSEPDDIVRGLAAGADNFITKPYQEEYLLARIEYMVVNQSLRQAAGSEMGLEVFFAGRKHLITADRLQVLDLLLAVFDSVLEKNRELRETNQQLQEALDTVKTLKGLIPICASCKKIRNDQGFWQHVERYLMEHSEAELTHSICPECVETLYPEIAAKRRARAAAAAENG